MMSTTDVDGNPLALLGDNLVVDMSEGCGDMDAAQVEKHWTGESLPQVHGFIFRGTEGNVYDDRVLQYVAKVKSFGCEAIGIYGWHNPKREAAKNLAQADALVQLIEQIGFMPKLGLWQDDETDYDHLTFQEMREAIMKYNDRVEQSLGMQPGTCGKYSRKWWWWENVANPTNGWTDIPRGLDKPGFKPKGRPVWYCHPDSPPPMLEIDDWVHRFGLGAQVFHQYSFRGSLNGIPGAVDYNVFNGTLAEYCAYFDVEVATPPQEPPPGGDGLHLAEILVQDSSLRRDPVFDPSTLYGKAILGAKMIVTEEIQNDYRKGIVWIWNRNIRLLD